RFQGAMHALMTTVLLGVAGFDSLMSDPELGQKHSKRRQPSGGTAGEWRPVVGAYGIGQSVLAEVEQQHRSHLREPGAGCGVKTQKEATVMIGQGEGHTVRPVLRGKVSLVIDAPEGVWSLFSALDASR